MNIAVLLSGGVDSSVVGSSGPAPGVLGPGGGLCH